MTATVRGQQDRHLRVSACRCVCCGRDCGSMAVLLFNMLQSTNPQGSCKACQWCVLCDNYASVPEIGARHMHDIV
jgi:hypothetical protein